MSKPQTDAPKTEKVLKDLEPDANEVKGGRLASSVQKQRDDTANAVISKF